VCDSNGVEALGDRADRPVAWLPQSRFLLFSGAGFFISLPLDAGSRARGLMGCHVITLLSRRDRRNLKVAQPSNGCNGSNGKRRIIFRHVQTKAMLHAI
jgi:hypothetical protein